MNTFVYDLGESTSSHQLHSSNMALQTHNERNSVGDILRFLGFERYSKLFADEEVCRIACCY